ncbi:hypothetical protein, partial [Bacillus thuringiensis]|uniref:hypothetical protein n=1 Tax=Bacillus thuringiensis TaxID=1428 RepID=UPI001C92CB3E
HQFTHPFHLLKNIPASFDLQIQYRPQLVPSQILLPYVDIVNKRRRHTTKQLTLPNHFLPIKPIQNSQNISTPLLPYLKNQDPQFLTISQINNPLPYLLHNPPYQPSN